MYGCDYYVYYKLFKEIKKSNLRIEMIFEDEIIEGVGLIDEENDFLGDGECFKLIEILLLFGNYEKSNQYFLEEDIYIEGCKNFLLIIVQFFRLEFYLKFSKRKKIKSNKNMKEEDSYSLGEEFGEKEDVVLVC